MYVIRDIFRCKPGHSKSVAEKFKNSLSAMQKMKGFKSGRVLLDYVGSYWTVVLETEVDSLGNFEALLNEYATNKEMHEIMKGYMDDVEGGHREVFRIV
jgi:heme-degrading monooxygenase HmoA